jgi:prophage antirepressor-like protein
VPVTPNEGRFCFITILIKMTGNKNEIKIFESPEFGKVRTAIDEKGEPLFCLTDVCIALEIANPSYVKERLNQKGVFLKYTPTKGGKQNLLFISESNLYKLIFRSDKPTAREFEDWVTSEVLPSIRKTGQYSNDALIQAKLAQRNEIIAFLKEDNQRLFELAKSMNDTDKIRNNTVELIFNQHCIVANMMMDKMFGA